MAFCCKPVLLWKRTNKTLGRKTASVPRQLSIRTLPLSYFAGACGDCADEVWNRSIPPLRQTSCIHPIAVSTK